MDAQDQDARDEELSSIAAIYPELNIDQNTSHHATLELDVIPSSPLSIQFRDLCAPLQRSAVLSEESPIYTLAYLPPLHLDLTLPDGYPEEQPPRAVLSSRYQWLNHYIVERLQAHMSDLWEEYGHSAVVFAFIDFLQTEAEQAFGLLAAKLDGKPWYFDTKVKESLIAYNEQKQKDEFNKASYSCGVCLDAKPGSACHRMLLCRHVFCVSCLQDFYNNAITEGSTGEVKCLDPDCGFEGLTHEQRRAKKRKTLHPRELLGIPIERAQVERYIKIKLKKKVESDKNTVYCPRSWCQAPARSAKYSKFRIEDLESYPEDSDDEGGPSVPAENTAAREDRLAICSVCTYAFCRRCRRTWHGDHVACRIHSDAEEQISAEDKASEDWVRMYTSPCPSCEVPCQKTMGCNHMRCSECDTHFCYLCSAWLKPDDPYWHFNRQGTGCFQRLWDLESGDRGDQAAAEERVAFGGARGYEIDHVAARARGQPPPPQDPPQQADHAAIAHNGAVQPLQVARAIVPAQPVQVNRNMHAQVENQDRGLQRFLEMAANDEEDEWDSDGLEEDIQLQLHLLEHARDAPAHRQGNAPQRQQQLQA